MTRIEEKIEKYISEKEINNSCEIKRVLIEDIGWDNLPKGWTEKSVEKFAKSLAGKSATEKGFFDACVEKMTGNIDEPEAFCASVKDSVWNTTYWRGKDKTKKEIEKQKKGDK